MDFMGMTSTWHWPQKLWKIIFNTYCVCVCVFVSCWTPHGQGTWFKYILSMCGSCSHMIVFVFLNLYWIKVNIVWSSRVTLTQGLNLVSSSIFSFLLFFLPYIYFPFQSGIQCQSPPKTHNQYPKSQIVLIKLLQHKCNCRRGYIHKSSCLWTPHTHPNT